MSSTVPGRNSRTTQNTKYEIRNNSQIQISNVDKLVKNPKFRHTCEGRYPDCLKKLSARLRGNDVKGGLKTFYETIDVKNVKIAKW